jgi:hypothetical protein
VFSSLVAGRQQAGTLQVRYKCPGIVFDPGGRYSVFSAELFRDLVQGPMLEEQLPDSPATGIGPEQSPFSNVEEHYPIFLQRDPNIRGNNGALQTLRSRRRRPKTNSKEPAEYCQHARLPV